MLSDIKCDQCGRRATIVRCTPICRDNDPFVDPRFQSFASEVCFKIKCPKCGARLRVVDTTAT